MKKNYWSTHNTVYTLPDRPYSSTPASSSCTEKTCCAQTAYCTDWKPRPACPRWQYSLCVVRRSWCAECEHACTSLGPSAWARTEHNRLGWWPGVTPAEGCVHTWTGNLSKYQYLPKQHRCWDMLVKRNSNKIRYTEWSESQFIEFTIQLNTYASIFS